MTVSADPFARAAVGPDSYVLGSISSQPLVSGEQTRGDAGYDYWTEGLVL